MKERPILFSVPMVRAILGGRKTQTRRVLKQAIGPSLSVGCEDGVAELSWLHGDGPGHEVHETIKRVACPYGLPGDRLWVRETFFPAPASHGGGWHYKATEADDFMPSMPWKPSIHMPRAACRLVLEVTGVRVERLNNCSEADAAAEGTSLDFMHDTHRAAFRELWHSINGAESWNANPWVWVVEFRRIGP
ncbi:Morphogenetic protein [Cupriavidus sp. H19C3]|uniref:hypothetical protein n=1 Tax=Cupriavidus sp. H19C3 TaxID=3241603 RepID=UPI003BF8D6DF